MRLISLILVKRIEQKLNLNLNLAKREKKNET